MQIKRISSEELEADLIFRLNYLYHATLGQFIAIADNRKEILFVNKKVPQKDIDGFLEVIMFPDYGVAADGAPTRQFLEYVYKKYGFHTYEALFDAHAWRMEQKGKRRVEEVAKTVISLIEKEVNSENPIIKYDEFLAYEICKYSAQLNKSTPKNKMSLGHMYEFYFGYFLGIGLCPNERQCNYS